MFDFPEGRQFAEYRQAVSAVAADVAASHARGALDEQAAPAYLQGLRLSRWLFWRRLALIQKRLDRVRGLACLDFGCGMGVMLPFLADRFDRVYAVDVEPNAGSQFLEGWKRRRPSELGNVSVAIDMDEAGVGDGTLDLILALDVLEHVDELPGVLQRMRRALKPSGVLIVSGPTESLVYRLGRRVVGFSGHYHHRNVYDIRREMERDFRVDTWRRLPRPAPLFLLLQGEPLPS